MGVFLKMEDFFESRSLFFKNGFFFFREYMAWILKMRVFFRK